MAATNPPESKTPPSQQPSKSSQTSQGASRPPVVTLPPDTKAYPPPNVPRSAATTNKDMAYLQGLQQGGLPISASGTIELGIGRSICGELAHGSKVEDMKPLLMSAGSLAGSLSGSKLTGDQIADLYLASAKDHLC